VKTRTKISTIRISTQETEMADEPIADVVARVLANERPLKCAAMGCRMYVGDGHRTCMDHGMEADGTDARSDAVILAREVDRLTEAIDSALARRLYVEEEARQAHAEAARLRRELRGLAHRAPLLWVGELERILAAGGQEADRG
jgi:hypothetical protein